MKNLEVLAVDQQRTPRGAGRLSVHAAHQSVEHLRKAHGAHTNTEKQRHVISAPCWRETGGLSAPIKSYPCFTAASRLALHEDAVGGRQVEGAHPAPSGRHSVQQPDILHLQGGRHGYIRHTLPAAHTRPLRPACVCLFNQMYNPQSVCVCQSDAFLLMRKYKRS